MDAPRLDQRFWDTRWTQALRDHPEHMTSHGPNAHLVREAAHLRPGRALDAGCGHGSEAMWLAERGWRVSAVDFARPALAYAQATAAGRGDDIASRIEWVQGDLSTWAPEPDAYDLVVCLYVHIEESVADRIQRLASGVAPGGTLLLVGHRPIDPATGAATRAADQVQVSVEEAVEALDADRWSFVVAQEQERAVAGSGVDAVICARRLRGD